MYNYIRNNAIKLIKKNAWITFYMRQFNILIAKFFAKFIDDESFIRKQYKFRTGYVLNLENPTYYNEKIQWLKLYYREPILNKLVDKYSVRDYVRERIGDKYLIPVYGVFNSVKDIDFSKLPDKFVIKLTNGSSYNYICKQKTNKEIREIKHRFKHWIKNNSYLLGREWAYKDVKNRIMIEKYLEDESQYGLMDYKVFCFRGEVKFIQVDYCRFSGHKRNLYTVDWEYIPVEVDYESDPNADIKRPAILEEMIDCAKKLSQGFPHVRVDFYYHNESLYFGELTFYHGAGLLKYTPRTFEKEMGDWLILPHKL